MACAKAAQIASDMVGKPYKQNGNSPDGFDCSGLVQYSYLQAGVELPHGTRLLLRTTETVPRRETRAGDLLFFDEDGKRSSHVGIVLAEGEFVHAPATGGYVRTDSLADPYWEKRFREARRPLP